MRYRVIENDIAPFVLVEDEAGGLRSLWMDADLERTLAGAAEDRDWMPGLARRLEHWFRGDDVDFSEVPTPPGPDFQRQCWDACRTIPRGEVWSYAQLADAARRGSRATRAAGQAMRRNRLAVIIPCHRVIAASGRLHGYAGSATPGGRALCTKRALLELEGAIEAAAIGRLF